MLLDTLKLQYKNSFIEPRLSGRQVPEDFLKILVEKVNASTTLDEFLNAIDEVSNKQHKSNTLRHVITRIIAWENEPPFSESIKKVEKRLENITRLKKECVDLMADSAASELEKLEVKLIKALEEKNLQNVL